MLLIHNVTSVVSRTAPVELYTQADRFATKGRVADMRAAVLVQTTNSCELVHPLFGVKTYTPVVWSLQVEMEVGMVLLEVAAEALSIGVKKVVINPSTSTNGTNIDNRDFA